MTNITELRLALQANGYGPIPVRGKAAYLQEWQTKTNVSAAEVKEWARLHPDWSNTGILTATVPAFDLDIQDPDAVAACEEQLREWFDGHGTLITRFGNPPKRAILFQTPVPFKKIRADFVAPNGSEHHIEVLGDGQQIVVEGTHPDSHRPYSWHGGQGPLNVNRNDLPKIDEDAAARAVELLGELLVEKFGFHQVPLGGPNGNGHDTSAEFVGKVDVEAELAAMLPQTTNHVHCRVGGSLLTAGVPYDDIAATLIDATMTMAPQHYRSRGWTREKEVWFVYKCLANLLKQRCRPLSDDDLRPAPSWVMPELADTWEEIAEKGGRPCILWDKRAGWLVRNMAWAWDKPASTDGDTTESLHSNAEQESKPDIPDAVKEGPRPGTGRHPVIFSSGKFTADFVPPDYLIDGVVQRRFLYGLTGMTGHGKTAILLLLAAYVAIGRAIGKHEIEQGNVIILAGENPDDVRMRWMAMAERVGFDPNAVGVHFLPGVFPVAQMKAAITKYAQEVGCEFALVIVDTSAAYFHGAEENSNTQMGAHARDLRTLVNVPGGPCVIASCHPTKNADLENLLPRGGGAFLNELDGNLICRKSGSDSVSEVHWHGKYRGADFNPLPFELRPDTAAKLVDSKGRPIPTVIAVPLDEAGHSSKRAESRAQEDTLLIILADQDGLSLNGLAEQAGWITKLGEPNKARAQRVMNRLKDDRLVKNERGDWTLTDAGEKAAEKAIERRSRRP